MYKLLGLLLLLVCFELKAQSTCQVFEYQGVVRIQNEEMKLLINESTLSEIRFVLPIQTKSRMAPFLDITVKGKLTLKNNRIQNILSADYGRATPLKHKTDSFIKLLKEESCK